MARMTRPIHMAHRAFMARQAYMNYVARCLVLVMLCHCCLLPQLMAVELLGQQVADEATVTRTTVPAVPNRTTSEPASDRPSADRGANSLTSDSTGTDGERSSSVWRFIDKNILNGYVLGSSIGSAVAIAGVCALAVSPPGLLLTMTASTIGGLVGGLAGSYVDDRVGEAYNYSDFRRPPVTKGGLVLEDAGFWEQTMYQIDAWGITGPTVAQVTQAALTRGALHLAGSALPGIGPFVTSIAGQAVIGAIGYGAGCASDVVDGHVSLADYGRRLDGAPPRP